VIDSELFNRVSFIMTLISWLR